MNPAHRALVWARWPWPGWWVWVRRRGALGGAYCLLRGLMGPPRVFPGPKAPGRRRAQGMGRPCRSATVVADTTVRLLVISPRHFSVLLWTCLDSPRPSWWRCPGASGRRRTPGDTMCR